MKNNQHTLVIALLVAVVLTLYLVGFQVRETELVAVTTFGRIDESKGTLPPGLHWKWPWPIQSLVRHDARLRIYEGPLDEMKTADGLPILSSFYLSWRITDLIAFTKKVGDRRSAENFIDRVLRNHKGSVLGRHPFKHLVALGSDGKVAHRIDQLEEEMREGIRKTLSDQYGIEIVSVGLRKLELPEQTTAKVFERMKAERQWLAEQYLAEGEREATTIRAKADEEKASILAKAAAEAKLLRGQADAESAQYYEVFAANPELAIYLRKIEALKTVLEKRSTVVLDTNTPPFDLLKAQPARDKTP